MSHSSPLSRRNFLKSASTAAAASVPLTGCLSTREPSHSETAVDLTGRIYKTLKIGMIKVPGTLTEKFAAAKEAGFEGVELAAPGINIAEAKKAIAETGLPIDGNVNTGHWQVRHTDPDAGVRAKALEALKKGLHETREVGGHTLLLVVGHGKDGPEKEIWPRSVENIAKAVPLAAELGVTIAIENVWNHFCYDHEGGADQNADKLKRYVDDFRSPWVAMQYDLGNHWKYGPTGDWVRALGNRVVKLDIKGYSRAEQAWAKIGEGDVDWADIRMALHEINFHGWCAAEVRGGDLNRLKEVSANMDRVFGLQA